MRRRVAVLAVIGLCGGLSGCDGDDTAERFITEVAGPFGAVAVGDRVWVTSADELVELDLTELSVIERTALPAPPRRVYALDGVIWTTSSLGARPVGIAVPDGVSQSGDLVHDSLAAVDGRVFAVRGADLYELDAATGVELGRVTLPPTDNGGERIVFPTPLVADGSSLWLTRADGGTSRLTRLDPNAGTLEFDIRIPDATTSAVLVGDRVWLADRLGELLWVDTATGERTEVESGFPKGETILDDGPSLFTGPDGTLWALDQPAQVVSQLDPATGAVIASAQLRDRPSSMAVTATQLVFANGFDDSITVLDRSELVSAT